MNTYFTLKIACRGYRAGSKWLLKRITPGGWWMTLRDGGDVFWSNPNLFTSGW